MCLPIVYYFRSITKILGEWWANLDKEEKACYTGLAKQVNAKLINYYVVEFMDNNINNLIKIRLFQYKDAFFNAHPDFKWYKLPAPPLRTLSARPRETPEKHEAVFINETHETELEKTNNNSTKVDFNKKPNDIALDSEPKTLSMFTPGKLADEANMGGLSSLLSTKTETQTLNPYYSPPSFKFNAISTPNDYRSQSITKGASEDNIRDLQNALTETTKVFEEEFEGKEAVYHYGNIANDQFTNQDVIDQIVDKRFSKDEDRNWSDEEKNAKSGRSCKGKRYQEFMSVGGLIANKRQKKDLSDKLSDDGYSANYSWEPGSSRSDESVSNVTDETMHVSSNVEISTENDCKDQSIDENEPDNNANKTFKAADFDLDAKIRALPSLSLEKFQQKKRENKRKKKTINPKPKEVELHSHFINTVPRPIMDERRQMIESWRETVIGSQKRKPRKISITRLEINSMISSVDMHNAHKISPEIKLATEAPCTVAHDMEVGKQRQCNVDLLGLATLAEVAANTSKLEDSSFINTYTAKANDEYASKV